MSDSSETLPVCPHDGECGGCALRAMYAKQLGSILSLMDTLNEVDTSKVEPTSHVLKLENVLRDDVPYFSDTREDILANSPDRKFDFVKVKKVID